MNQLLSFLALTSCLLLPLLIVLQTPGAISEEQPLALTLEPTESTKPPQGGYRYWREIAVKLAGLPPAQLVQELEYHDPFETRAFEAKLLQAEAKKGVMLNNSEIRNLFSCPAVEQRISLPDARNHTTMSAFQNQYDPSKPFTFLFFQHLRKAGGTNFCRLAQSNLLFKAVPTYYCMPDMFWSETNQCAGCLSRWNNSEIMSKMQSAGHRIAGNEWDAFDSTRFFELPAVFVTNFRRPLDRALSQFRFDCIDNRGCQGIQNISEWWDIQIGNRNIYTWTFTNFDRSTASQLFHSNQPQDGEMRSSLVGEALDTLSRFHLIMIMEWLGYTSDQVESVLGFTNTALLTHRIRPVHFATRNDGQEFNRLGATGVGLSSWNPKDYLSPELYQRMSEDLALDMILNEAARRMFLERMVCSDER